MKGRGWTIILLVVLVWPAGLALGQGQGPGQDGIGWSGAERMGMSHPGGVEAAEPWAPSPPNEPGSVIVVTTTEDEINGDGDCSLREAIQAANLNDYVDACGWGSGDDTIVVPAGTYVLSIPGADEDENQTGDLDILDNLVIEGDGAELTIIDGGRLDRVLQVHPGRSVEINDVTVTHGYLEDESGAGIANSSATLTLNRVTLSENQVVRVALNVGGAGLWSGARVEDATTTLNDCLVTENTAWGGGGILNGASTGLAALTTLHNTTVSRNTAEFGGGIWHTRSVDSANLTSAMVLDGSVVEANVATVDRGGGIAAYQGAGNVMTLTLIDSVISGNTAVVQGGGVAIHGYDTVPQLSVEHSTISGNVAQGTATFTGRGGGLWVEHSELLLSASTVSGNMADGAGFASGHGGGMFLLDSAAEAVNSTISGNEVYGSGLPDVSGLGGGIIVVGEVEPASLALTNTTVAGNSSNVGGGGIANAFFGADATTTFKNSLLGGNTAPEVGPSCYNADQWGGQGTLLSLGHNLEDYDTCNFDQPTDWPNTEALLAPLGDYGGPTETHALLTGSPAVNAGDDEACPGSDQRGVLRPQCTCSDIGAYEAEAVLVGGIAMRSSDWGGGRYLVRSLVQILSQGGAWIAAARVWAVWTLPDGSTRVQRKLTNQRGLAPFWVGSMQSGEYELCVSNVARNGYTYSPGQNVETCDVIQVP